MGSFLWYNKGNPPRTSSWCNNSLKRRFFVVGIISHHFGSIMMTTLHRRKNEAQMNRWSHLAQAVLLPCFTSPLHLLRGGFLIVFQARWLNTRLCGQNRLRTHFRASYGIVFHQKDLQFPNFAGFSHFLGFFTSF